MGSYLHAMNSFEESAATRSQDYKERLRKWRQGKTVERAASPTNPIRARTLGYKAKKEYMIVRVRIKRGKRSRKKADLGRKPAKNRKFINPGRSLQFYAEDKAMRRFNNLKIVNSYHVAEDGEAHYFEVIMKDPLM